MFRRGEKKLFSISISLSPFLVFCYSLVFFCIIILLLLEFLGVTGAAVFSLIHEPLDPSDCICGLWAHWRKEPRLCSGLSLATRQPPESSYPRPGCRAWLTLKVLWSLILKGVWLFFFAFYYLFFSYIWVKTLITLINESNKTRIKYGLGPYIYVKQ